MKKTDGRILAWIEDSKTKTTAFHEIGKQMYGLTIEDIRQDELTVKMPDGKQLTLKLREPRKFEENGKLAE